jgi:hypothetical protein
MYTVKNCGGLATGGLGEAHEQLGGLHIEGLHLNLKSIFHN